MLTQMSFPASLSLLHICPFCALRPHSYCQETAGPGLARTAAFSRTQNSGVAPSHRTSTAWGHRASGHRTGSSNGAELIWLLAWKSSCCCHAPLNQHRQPSLCLCVLGSVPEFQLPVQLHHDCQSRAGATTHQHPVRVSTEGVWERCCGGKSCVVVGRLPSTTSWEQLWPSQGRSATLQPAEGASGAAGSSRSGRRCWWPGPPGKH